MILESLTKSLQDLEDLAVLRGNDLEIVHYGNLNRSKSQRTNREEGWLFRLEAGVKMIQKGMTDLNWLQRAQV